MALAFALFGPLRRLVSDPELQPSLIALQAFRAIGVVWLVLLALNALPAVFAVPAGIGDLSIGLTAIRVAPAALTGGYQLAFTIAACLVGGALIVVLVALRPPQAAEMPEVEQEAGLPPAA